MFGKAPPFFPSRDPVTGGITLPSGIPGRSINQVNTCVRDQQKINRMLARGWSLDTIAIGDSICVGGGTSNNGLQQFGSSYVNVLCWTSGGRLRLIRNAGIAGQTSAQILARIDSDVIAYSPEVCILNAGTNDIAAGVSTNADYAAVMNNIESMVRRLLRAGILPIVAVPPPFTAHETETRKLRVLIYLLAEYYSIPLIDIYLVCVDAATGGWESGYNSDDRHPNPVAVTAIAAYYGPKIATLETFRTPTYLAAYGEASSGQFANLIRNGNFASGSPVPTGFNANASYGSFGTPSLPYNGRSYTATSHPVGNVLVTAANITAGYSVGDVLRFAGQIVTSGLTPGASNGVTVSIACTGKSEQPLYGWPYNGTFDLSTDFTVPSGTTTIAWSLYANDAGGTYTVSNLTLLNLTTARAVWTPGVIAD